MIYIVPALLLSIFFARYMFDVAVKTDTTVNMILERPKSHARPMSGNEKGE